MNLKTNPELLPLIEWWEKDGKSTVIWCLVAALALGGWYGYKGYRERRHEAARASLSTAQDSAQVQDAVKKYAGLPVEGALKLRLAKMCFDEGRYPEALELYEGLMAKTPDGFAGVPAVGKAQCLEAQQKFAEAQKAFDDFVAENPKGHYLTLAAQIGSVRCLVQQEKKAEALKAVAALKEQYKGDESATVRVKEAEDLVKRWEKPVPAAKPAAPVPAASASAVKTAAKPAAPVPAVKPEAKPAEPAKK